MRAMLPTTPLISVSLDLAGSTQAKAAILRTSAADPDNVADCYARIFSQFFHHEASFYLRLVSGGIPVDDVFLVKTIGDEVWVVVTAPPNEIVPRLVAVISACLLAVSKVVEVLCFERKLSEEEEFTDPDSLGLKRERLKLDIKAFADLIEKPYEVNALRQEAFQKSLADFQRSDGDPRAVLERLGGFGLNMLGGTRASVSHRTDFIGFEVDRFFRCTKFAEPGQLKIGRALAEVLPLAEGHTLPRCDDAPSDVTFAVSKTALRTLRLTRECLRRDDLKGIGQGYAIFRVEDPSVPIGF